MSKLLPIDQKTSDLVKALLAPIWKGRFNRMPHVDFVAADGRIYIDKEWFAISIDPNCEHEVVKFGSLINPKPKTKRVVGPQYILERTVRVSGGREEPDDFDIEEVGNYDSIQSVCQDIVMELWSTYANDEMHAFYVNNDL